MSSMDKGLFVDGAFEKIDDRLLEKRQITEGNVCGCILKDPSVIDDSGLKRDDFLTKHGRLLFDIASIFRDKNVTEPDEVSYITCVSDEIRNRIEDSIGGWKQIGNLISVISIKNWDTYLDDLNKSNILVSLYKKGFNVFTKVQLENGKEVVPVELFKKFTSAQVLDWYNNQVVQLTKKINSAKIVEEGFMDFDEEFLDKLLAGEEVGVDYGDAGEDIDGNKINVFPFMSKNTMGLKHGTLNGFAASSGCGKSTYMVSVAMALLSKGETGVLVSNESQISDVKTQFLIWYLTRYMNYWKITKNKLISGDLTPDDRKKIQEARISFREKYSKKLKIVTLADADASLTCQIIKNSIQRDGSSFFILDTFKLSFNESANEAFWLSLVGDTRALAEIALKYNVIGLMTIQLAISSQNTSFLSAANLSQSKAIKEVLSTLVLFRKLVPSLELDPKSPYYIHPFRSKQNPDGTWYEEPYEPDPNKMYRVFFVDKARRGRDSADTGVAYLSRFDGDFCSYYETAKCRPSRKIFSGENK